MPIIINLEFNNLNIPMLRIYCPNIQFDHFFKSNQKYFVYKTLRIIIMNNNKFMLANNYKYQGKIFNKIKTNSNNNKFV